MGILAQSRIVSAVVLARGRCYCPALSRRSIRPEALPASFSTSEQVVGDEAKLARRIYGTVGVIWNATHSAAVSVPVEKAANAIIHARTAARAGSGSGEAF